MSAGSTNIVVANVEDDGAIARLNRRVYEAEGFEVHQTPTTRGAITLIDTLAERRRVAQSDGRAAWSGRLVLDLDGQFPDGGDAEVTEQEFPELFGDRVVQRARATGSRLIKATLVARYAVHTLGADSVGFVLSSSYRDDEAGRPDGFLRSDIVSDSAEEEQVPTPIVPKPFSLVTKIMAVETANHF